MSSAPTIDLDQLLSPIEGDNPCGEDLRWDLVYDQINEACSEKDKDALVESEEPSAQWPLVVDLATEVLGQRSKDLRFVDYLTRGLVEIHGFPGLRDGFKLVSGLLDNFWDNLHPEIDPEDTEPLEKRVGPLNSLTDIGKGAFIPNRIRDIALAPRRPDSPIFSYNYSVARRAPPKGENEDEDAYLRRKADADEKGRLFEDAAASTGLEFYQNLYEDLQECQTELFEFDKRVDEKFGNLAPGTTQIRQALEECEGLIRRILKDKGGLTEDTEDEEGADAEEAGGDGQASGGPSGPGGPIRTRQDAMKRLEEVAAYLRRTEPHSPMSYLIQRALSWSQMSLEQLLLELVEDEGVRSRIDVTLGIRRADGQPEQQEGW